MTDPWTYEQHLAQAEALALKADDLADGEVPGSQAAQRRLDIEQTALRSLAHGKLAELKKPTEAPRPAPKPQRQPKSTGNS